MATARDNKIQHLEERYSTAAIQIQSLSVLLLRSMVMVQVQAAWQRVPCCSVLALELPIGWRRGKELHVLRCLALSDLLVMGLMMDILDILVRRYNERDAGIKLLNIMSINKRIAMGPGQKTWFAVGNRWGRCDRVPQAKNRFAIICLHLD